MTGDLTDAVAGLLADRADVEAKQMFGGTGFMVSGRLAIATNKAGEMMVRVRRERVPELLERPGTDLAVMGTRTMKEWIDVDPGVAADPAELQFWVNAAIERVSMES